MQRECLHINILDEKSKQHFLQTPFLLPRYLYSDLHIYYTIEITVIYKHWPLLWHLSFKELTILHKNWQ